MTMMGRVFPSTTALAEFSSDVGKEGPQYSFVVIDSVIPLSFPSFGAQPSTPDSRPLGGPAFPMGLGTRVPFDGNTMASLGVDFGTGNSVRNNSQMVVSINGPQGMMFDVIPAPESTQSFNSGFRRLLDVQVGGTSTGAGMLLSNRDNDTLAQLPSFVGVSQFSTQGRDVIQPFENVPQGGNMPAQVFTTSNLASEAGVVSTFEVQAPLSLDIQRQEIGVPTATGALFPLTVQTTGLTQGSIGISPAGMIWGQGFGYTSSTELSSTLLAVSGASSRPLVSNRSLDDEADTVAEVVNLGSFNLRVGTGPLFYRSTSPVGPALAADLAELVPLVERCERAIASSIDELELGYESEDIARNRADRSKSTYNSVAVSALGALPLKITGLLNRSDTDELTDLLDSLRKSLDFDNPSTVLAAPTFHGDEFSSTLANTNPSTPTSRIAREYLTVACAVALGMSLYASPFSPDILMIAKGIYRRRSRYGFSSFTGMPTCFLGLNAGVRNWRKSSFASRFRNG